MKEAVFIRRKALNESTEPFSHSTNLTAIATKDGCGMGRRPEVFRS
jgi:hypothetical protein